VRDVRHAGARFIDLTDRGVMVSETAVCASDGARVSVVLVCGPPKAGKTTLITHARRAHVASGVGVFIGELGTPATIATRVCEWAAGGDARQLLIELAAVDDLAAYATALSEPHLPVRLSTVVAVVDAERLLSDFCSYDLVADRFPERADDQRSWVDALVEHIEFADLLVINKVDRVRDGTLRSIHTLLAALNPSASVHESVLGSVPTEMLLGTKRFQLQRAQRHSAWSRLLAGEEIPAARKRGVGGFVYRRRRPFHPHRLMDFFNSSWPGVIRARGTFWLATRMDWQGELSQVGPARRYRAVSAWLATALESRSFDPTYAEELTGIPWDAAFGDRRQEIAFIGMQQDLDEDSLSEALDACLLDDEEMRRGREVWQGYDDPFPPWDLQVSFHRHISAEEIR
jgi:G3E family GTPase